MRTPTKEETIGLMGEFSQTCAALLADWTKLFDDLSPKIALMMAIAAMIETATYCAEIKLNEESEEVLTALRKLARQQLAQAHNTLDAWLVAEQSDPA